METKRSRFKAQSSGRPYRLTPIDLRVLNLLQRYRYLPSNYIGALLGIKGEYYQVILGKLRHEAQLVDCPTASWSAANARYRSAVYSLTRNGERLLKDQGFYALRPKTGHEFNHELMVCLIQASFELGAREHGLTLITAEQILEHPCCPRERRFEVNPWAIPVCFELNKQRIEKSVETDGSFFGFARQGNGGRTVLICPGFEADRATEPLEPANYGRSGIQIKFAQFRAIASQGLYGSRYGIPTNPSPVIIPFVTINEAHKRALMRVLDLLTNGKGSTLFIFKSIPNFAAFENFPPPTGHMVSEPWERVGHPPFNIINELGREVI